jgi:cholesterol 7-dehydrogenase
MDAYCPHLGANLGIGGKVIGNCIECPFHGWQFNKNGECVNIPYCDTIPKLNSKIKTYPIKEINRMIFMYFDCDNENPTWEVPLIPQIETDEFIIHGIYEQEIRTHIQEIPENGPDSAHLYFLHVPFFRNSFSFLKFIWNITWKAGEKEEEYLTHINVTMHIEMFGYPIPFTHIKTKINQIGPALVHLYFETLFGQYFLIETVTPKAPLEQKVTHLLFGKNSLFSKFFCKILLLAFIYQFQRDVEIWNFKTYLSKPTLVKGDGPIQQFRRWYSKFYPKKDYNSSTSIFSHSLEW